MTTTLRKLALGVVAAGLAWAGAALAQSGQTGGTAAGVSGGSPSDDSVSSPARQGDTPTTAGGETAKSSGDQVVGKVDKISHSDSSISVRDSEHKEQKLKVDSDTAVMKDGRRAKFDDIEPGDEVRASMAGSGGCTRLDVTSPDAKGSSGK